ncbi:MAG: class 3 adenylate cyclase [bacterium]|jgi:class 3 adenylate cyclase
MTSSKTKKAPKGLHISIRLKLALMVSVAILFTTLCISLVILQQIKDDLYRQTIKIGKISLNYVADNSAVPLLTGQIPRLIKLIKASSKVEGIQYVSIVNRENIIKAHIEEGSSGSSSSLLGEKLPKFQSITEKNQEGDLQYFQHKLKNKYQSLNLSKPIKIKNKVIGRVHLGVDLEFIQQRTDAARNNILTIGFGTVAVGFILAFILSTRFTKPIVSLKNSALDLAEAKYDIDIDTSSSDELGSLARSFDTMRHAIKNKINDLQVLNEASQRFVPQEFIHLLKKQSIVEVELGDSLQMDVSVLFSDIRSFTSLSESMTPEENFQFLNSYLAQMNPEIQKYKGFIDKYIGDAIMALFPESADSALRGAIGMMKALHQWNLHRIDTGRDAVNIGLGINTGSLMLGTIGGKERMEGTVISDAVNLASRVEGMTKMYAANILISENTYLQLRDPSQYNIRIADRVTVKGKKLPVTVYEVFDGDRENILESKRSILEIFEQGIKLYQSQKFKEGKAVFKQCLAKFPEDRISSIYMERCEELQKEKLGADWNGVINLTSK